MRVMKTAERGQALLLTTFSLIAIFGVIGLLVDLSWAYYLEKKFQGAADTAALAAVREALDTVGGVNTTLCASPGIGCLAVQTPCPGLPGNLNRACVYADQNLTEVDYASGLTDAIVTVMASDINPPTVYDAAGGNCSGTLPLYYPPTAPCVDVKYWVTVRVSRNVPQLFSAILGNTEGTVASRATAAIARGTNKAGLYLLNKENDPFVVDNQDYTGTNLRNAGGPTVVVPNGIVMASGDTTDAGFLQGSADVIASSTTIWGGGQVDYGGANSEWDAVGDDDDGDGWFDDGNNIHELEGQPVNSSDVDLFLDPFYGMGQPPIYELDAGPPNLPIYEVPFGDLNQSPGCAAGRCLPGIYYATGDYPAQPNSGIRVPSGEQIFVSGNQLNLTFGDGNTQNLDTFIFFGGMAFGGNNIDFEPGRYVYAGVLDQNDYLIDTDTNTTLTGGVGSFGADMSTRDLGRIFILTDDQYALDTVRGGSQLDFARNKIDAYYALTQLPGLPQELSFGATDLKGGNNPSTSIELQGLNPTHPGAATQLGSLEQFSPVVIWQDQRNSEFWYDDDGTYHCGRSSTAACPNPQTDGRGDPRPQMDLAAGQNGTYWGAVYQPRGAWMTMQGAPADAGPIQVITGAIEMQGGGVLKLIGPETPTFRYIAALVE